MEEKYKLWTTPPNMTVPTDLTGIDWIHFPTKNIPPRSDNSLKGFTQFIRTVAARGKK